MTRKGLRLLGPLSILAGASCGDEVAPVPCTSQIVEVGYGQVATFPCTYSRTPEDGCGDDTCGFSLARSDGAVRFDQGWGFGITQDKFSQVPEQYLWPRRELGTTSEGRTFAFFYVPEADSPGSYAYGVIVIESKSSGFEGSMHVQYKDSAVGEVLAIIATMTYQ